MSISIEPDFRVVDAILPTNLLLPGATPSFQSVTLAGGFGYPPGAVIGIASTGANAGLALLCDPAAGDGSQRPIGIVPTPIATFASDNATPQAKNASIYRTGNFNLAYLYAPAWSNTMALRVALMINLIVTSEPGYSG